MKNRFDCVYPCPCSYNGDPQKACTCAAAVVTKYQKRISGPILDRIDIHIEVPRVDYEKLSSDRLGETSASIRARVQAARDIQTKRFRNNNIDIICNADMHVGEIRQFCRLQEEGQRLIRAAMTQLNRIDMYIEVSRVDTKNPVMTESRNPLHPFESVCKPYARESAGDSRRMAHLTVYECLYAREEIRQYCNMGLW